MDEQENDENLESGWAFDPYGGGAYHFKPLAPRDAEKLMEGREAIYVIETLDWTLAEAGVLHRKTYFAAGLRGAIAAAARMEIELKETDEDVMTIRPATMEEATTFFNVQAHFDAQMPHAISEAQALELWSEDDEA